MSTSITSKKLKQPKVQEENTMDSMEISEYLDKAKELLEVEILNKKSNSKNLQEAKTFIEKFQTFQKTPFLKKILEGWFGLLYIITIGLVEAIFIEFYCLWHGASFISLDLYNPVNVDILSKITFVNGATTMSIAAEVMTWSSLGVWASGTFQIAKNFGRGMTHYSSDIQGYIAMMVRNTSVAAIVVIILRLTKFSIFDISLDSTSPYAFDATIGLSFLLGFFGDDAYKILVSIKNSILKDTPKTPEE